MDVRHASKGARDLRWLPGLCCMDKGYTLKTGWPESRKLAFDWDGANIAHIARHAVTPAEAEEVVSGASLPLETDERAVKRGMPNWAPPPEGGC